VIDDSVGSQSVRHPPAKLNQLNASPEQSASRAIIAFQAPKPASPTRRLLRSAIAGLLFAFSSSFLTRHQQAGQLNGTVAATRQQPAASN